MKRTLAILSVVLLLLIAVALPLLAAPASLPPTQGTDAIRAAVQNRLETLPDPDLRWQVAETVQAGDWAYATARATSRTSGQPAPTEPLVILARRAADGSWQAALPGERLFDAWLAAAPESLIDAQTKRYLGTSPAPAGPQAEVTGYKVPWLEGYKGTVVRRDGTNHDKQVDFNLWTASSAWGAGTVAAAKGGTVVFAKDSSNSGCASLDCWRQANMVVIRHAANEYSWYVHLAYQSVPEGVYAGAAIASGEPIGVEGETGFATGVHLHYMVSSDLPTLPDPNDPNAAAWPQNRLTFDFAEAAWEELQAGLVLVSQNSPGPAECPQAGGAILYKHAGYDCGGQGEGLGYVQRSDPGWQNVPAGFNDRASSLHLPAGASVRLYQHVDRAGASACRNSDDETFEGDYFDGGQVLLNDQVSSFELFAGSGCAPIPEAGPQKWKARYDAGDACWWDSGCRPSLCLQTLDGPGLAVDWAAGAPCGDLAGDDWVGEFRTALDFDQGEYVFYLDHDGGAQLWLDGRKIAHHDGPGARRICDGERGYPLDGRHSLRLLLREETGDAQVRLAWDTDASACQPKPVRLDLATGLTYRASVEIVLARAGKLTCACRKVVETDAQGGIAGLDLTGCAQAGELYDVYVKPGTALRQVVPAVHFQQGENQLALGDFVAGDTTWAGQTGGDNQVNLMDYRNVLDGMGGTDPGQDVNGDGLVDALDLATVGDQWGRRGAGWTDASPCQAAAAAPADGGESQSGGSPAASLALSPAAGAYQVGDTFELEVHLDTGGQDVAGVDLLIDYDPGVLRIVDADPALASVQIRAGSAFSQIHHNAVDVTAGEIRYSADTGDGPAFRGQGLAAILPFSVVASIEHTAVGVRYGEGWTAESNAVVTGTVGDILGQASGAALQLAGSPRRSRPGLSLVPGSRAILDARAVEIKAGVTDAYSQVQEVRFEARQEGGDWALLGTDTTGADGWGLVWDALAAPDGEVDLRATALLLGGVGTTITSTQVLLDRRPPEILAAVASPSPAPRPGAAVTIEVTATDGAGGGSGIEGIDVYVAASAGALVRGAGGGAWILLGSMPAAMGHLIWDTAGWAPGAYQIAFDVRDRAGNRGPVPEQRLTLEIEVDRPYGLYLPLVREP